jgi:hypothetical protein
LTHRLFLPAPWLTGLVAAIVLVAAAGYLLRSSLLSEECFPVSCYPSPGTYALAGVGLNLEPLLVGLAGELGCGGLPASDRHRADVGGPVRPKTLRLHPRRQVSPRMLQRTIRELKMPVWAQLARLTPGTRAPRYPQGPTTVKRARALGAQPDNTIASIPRWQGLRAEP